MTLFEKIIAREIPADIVHEDELSLVFRDINPQAPIHLLIIPKKPIPRIGEAGSEDQSLLGHLLLVAGKVADQLGINSTDKGFRLIINNGANGGEAVPHLHIHLLADRPLNWPPG
ncbi:MAG: histidine triad nucleotide-binding protein [Verrucomicrobiae bacterium]|nr:histidine triad nucleotide-binding protein [Verrucomicrobiae bacterium]